MRLILLTFDVGELKILSKKESALFVKNNERENMNQRDFDRKLKAFGGKCYFTAQSSKW